MNNKLTDDRKSFFDLNLWEITIHNHCYKISDKPKRGANFLVYEAIKVKPFDSKYLEHKIILKEFFPIVECEDSFCITRNPDGSLMVPEEIKSLPSYKHRLEKFRESYKILLELNKSADWVEHAVPVHDLIEANGTWYIEEVYDAGVLLFDYFETYDIFPSVRQFLNFIIYSLEIVGNLHKLGYYHLDIKPNNLSFTKSGIVRFFDTDSFIKITELDTCQTFSQSYGFSAPELSHACERPYDAPYLIGPWTDIYSLAQFVCFYFFGKTVSYPELRDLLPRIEEFIIYTDYYTDGQWFEKYSDTNQLQNGTFNCKPLIPRNGVFLLKRFLLKALNPKLDKRYRKTEEAIKDLEQIRDHFYNYQFQLIDCFQEFIPEYFEHDKELDHLESIFINNTTNKSDTNTIRFCQIRCDSVQTREEFAKYYATLNRDAYDSIHEIRGMDFEKALLDLSFFEAPGFSIEQDLSMAISTREHPTLIIFYDESNKTDPVNDGPFIKYLIESPIQNLHVLFVTSNDRISRLNNFQTRYRYPIYNITLYLYSNEVKPHFYDKLWQYDWFLDFWTNLYVFKEVFGWHFGALGLFIAGLFSPLCMTIAIHGYVYRRKKMSGVVNSIKQYVFQYWLSIFLWWLCLVIIKQFFFKVTLIKIIFVIILWLLLHYLEHLHRFNG